MLNLDHFRRLVVRPACKAIYAWSPVAEDLLMGTALAESDLRHLEQLGGGPALGLFQIEPRTEIDVWGTYLLYRQERAELVLATLGGTKPPPGDWTHEFLFGWRPDAEQLATNLIYSAIIARLIYLRRPEPFPIRGDVPGLASYWKQWFNTPLGKGTEAHFIELYEEHLL